MVDLKIGRGVDERQGRNAVGETAPPVRRNTILPTCRDGPPPLGCDDQGTVGLRAGPSTAQGGTRSRSLRGTVVARSLSSCTDNYPPVLPARKNAAGKKNQRTAASTDPTGRPARHRGSHRPNTFSTVSKLPNRPPPERWWLREQVRSSLVPPWLWYSIPPGLLRGANHDRDMVAVG
jgi:hypothetical protein